MPVLPTAHASQSYGRRQLEFFATTGHITGSDRRQRASERRFQDMDGAIHTVRMANPDAPMAPGDSVAVLRAQSGPDRQSRPVSVINYASSSWEAAAPDASRALSRAGITRGVNWWLSMIALALAAIVLVWPDLRTALTELNPSLFGGLPAFDLIGLVASQASFLIGADPAASIPGLDQVVASTGIFDAGDANGVLLGLGLAVLGLIAYVGRTWRVVWIPVFLIAALASGLVLAGVEGAAGITLIAIGGLAAFFAIAGFINRIRDASRFRSRVARLSEHMLRNPPQESVISPPPAEPRRVSDGALAAAAGPVAAAAVVDQALAEAPEVEAELAADDEATEPEDTADDTGDDTAAIIVAPVAETETEPQSDSDPAGDDAAPEDRPDRSPDPETPRTLTAAPAVTDEVPETQADMAPPADPEQDRDARTSAAFGALAAAMATESAAPSDTSGEDDDDDLPSDADLARARGEQPVEASVTAAADPQSVEAGNNDRDLTLPEPPPLASPQPGALASAPQASLGVESEAVLAEDSGDADNTPPDAEPEPEPVAPEPGAPVLVTPVTVEDVPELDPDMMPEEEHDPMMARPDVVDRDDEDDDNDPSDRTS
ncbi:MAG: hypothetical protein CMF74_00420 [Maricaulis sp.]|jgi:hypothetical protein|nr:hypothetical protein [Maricaulis sp.]HAQ34417.1 hypothetical protein [Alphaproteobacteria bacterium]